MHEIELEAEDGMVVFELEEPDPIAKFALQVQMPRKDPSDWGENELPFIGKLIGIVSNESYSDLETLISYTEGVEEKGYLINSCVQVFLGNEPQTREEYFETESVMDNWGLQK